MIFNMKHLFYILITSLCLLAGCGKEEADSATPLPPAYGTLELSLGGCVLPPSRATGVGYAAESALHRWAYWVFDEDGRPVQCREGQAQDNQLSLLSGRYTVVAVVNYPTDAPWALPLVPSTRLDQLLASVTDLSCNSPAGLLMVGCDTVRLQAAQNTRLQLEVRRLVSKVTVRKVSVAFEDPVLAARDTRLRGIYLTNVCRRTPYGADFTPDRLPQEREAWYNPLGWRADSCAHAACDALLGDTGLDRALTPELPYTREHSFYPFPNPTPPSQDHRDGSWRVRSTRLVLEVAVGGGIYYYPIRIPAMARNHPYVAEEVILRKLGSLDPEQEIPGAVEVRLGWPETESQWDSDFTINEDS